MSQLLTYKNYINYLTAEARKARLDDLAAGILRADGMVAELQAELKAKDEQIDKLENKIEDMTDSLRHAHGAD